MEVHFEAAAPDVVAAFGHPLDDLQSLEADACRLLIDVPNLEWFAARLAAVGVDFHVVAPTELQEHVAAMAARLTRATATSLLQFPPRPE